MPAVKEPKSKRLTPEQIEPLDDRVLVKLDEPPETTEGGLWLPDTVRGQEKQAKKIGTVVRVGPGKRDPDDKEGLRRIPLNVKVGQRVLFSQPWSATPVQEVGADLLMLTEHDLLAIIEDE